MTLRHIVRLFFSLVAMRIFVWIFGWVIGSPPSVEDYIFLGLAGIVFLIWLAPNMDHKSFSIERVGIGLLWVGIGLSVIVGALFGFNFVLATTNEAMFRGLPEIVYLSAKGSPKLPSCALHVGSKVREIKGHRGWLPNGSIGVITRKFGECGKNKEYSWVATFENTEGTWCVDSDELEEIECSRRP